ncbi:hypothetical protein ACFVU2_19000 [Leifsonia sp. NPDC058194]|uniref:hypothetical protein n=1 Tax=Leifsonia sp. NPDC058194 TaxID=3346374 RepID=UPI0036DBFB73
MFRDTASKRSIRQVLRDRTGSSIAEAIAGVALILVIAGALGMGATTDIGAISTMATKAERQALVTSLVGDVHAISSWGTPSAPNTQTITLPNGHQVKVTTWRVDTAVSTTLTAVAPISSSADAADCSGPSALAKQGCIYASRLHADGLDGVEPYAIVRKDPTMGATAPVGTVDPRVSTTTSIPQGTTFATGTDSVATVWRYLVTAHSTESNGEIQITQAGKVLALFPVDGTENNYFGTFTAQLNTPVTATVTSGNVIVKNVFIYRAGSTS